MVWPALWTTGFFAKVCAIARGTCHVRPIGLQIAPSSFRRSGASNEYSQVLIGPAVRAPETKMLGQTNTQTNVARPTFSSDPAEEIFKHKAFKAKALRHLYSTILNERPVMQYRIALCQNLIFISLGFKLTTPINGLGTLPWSCHGRSELNGVFSCSNRS